MIRVIKIFFILFCLHTSVFGQDSTYYRIYGGLLNETASDIKEDSDSTYMILGTTGSNEAVQSDFYLVKVDSVLDFIWSKHLGSSNSDKAESLLKTDDGYLLLGYTLGYNSENYDVLLIKVDSEGNELWSQTYGGDDWDFGYEIIEHPDGGYLIVGETYSYGLGQNDVYLIYVDEDGEEQWHRTFGSPLQDVGRDLVVVDDDHIAITGTSNGFNEFGVNQSSLIRVDFDGELINYTYYGYNNQDGRAIIAKGDHVVIAGKYEDETLGEQAFVLEVYPSNFPVFFSPIGFAEDQAFFDLFSFESNYYMAGYTFEGDAGAGDIYLYEGNEVASFISGTIHGEEGYDSARRILLDSDSSIVVLGTTTMSETSSSDIIGMKLNLGSLFLNVDSISLETYYDAEVLVEEVVSIQNIKFFPNPGNGDFNLDLPSNKRGGDLVIYNSSGQICYTENNILSPSVSTNLQSGIYFIEYLIREERYRGKLVVR